MSDSSTFLQNLLAYFTFTWFKEYFESVDCYTNSFLLRSEGKRKKEKGKIFQMSLMFIWLMGKTRHFLYGHCSPWAKHKHNMDF